MRPGAGQGAVFLVSLTPDGHAAGTMLLSPSTWGGAGPSLAANAMFGASIALKAYKRDGYELSVGAPGVDNQAGAVFTFDMAEKHVRSHFKQPAPEPSRRVQFGSAVEYGADLNGNGVPELFVSARGAMYTLAMGTDHTYGHWWQSRGVVTNSTHTEVGSARRVVLFGNGANVADLPIYWLPPLHTNVLPATAVLTSENPRNPEDRQAEGWFATYGVWLPTAAAILSGSVVATFCRRYRRQTRSMPPRPAIHIDIQKDIVISKHVDQVLGVPRDTTQSVESQTQSGI